MKALLGAALCAGAMGCGSDGGKGAGDAGGGGAGDAGACGSGPQTATQKFAEPARPKYDFLFVVDNSGSMCEEQANLAANFQALAQALVGAGQQQLDFRIAVTNTDLRTESAKGRFQDAPSPVQGVNCSAGVAPPDCAEFLGQDGHWTFGPILRSGPEAEGGNAGADAQALYRRFACLATLGTNGDGFEKGLEAMRLALSCDGPNGDAFGACCVDETGPEGQVVGRRYDPACAPAAEPDFLRPDATLAVVFVTDEADCSDPSSNPAHSKRAICKYGPHDGVDGDDVPDGFLDATLCPEGPVDCYMRECGALPPDACYQARCAINRGDNNNCVWFGEALTPVTDYADFLRSLKTNPGARLIVAALAGPQVFVLDPSTGAPVEVTYTQGRPTPACAAPDNQGNPSTISTVSWECCPDGRCTGGEAPACASSTGLAFSGRRYQQLAESFGVSGIGCPAGAPPDTCITVCDDSFQRLFASLRDKLVRLDTTYCLEQRPECRTAAGPCATDADRENPQNYQDGLTVYTGCADTAATGGGCAQIIEEAALPAGQATVVSNPACASGLAVELAAAPPPGGTVRLTYPTPAQGEACPD